MSSPASSPDVASASSAASAASKSAEIAELTASIKKLNKKMAKAESANKKEEALILLAAITAKERLLAQAQQTNTPVATKTVEIELPPDDDDDDDEPNLLQKTFTSQASVAAFNARHSGHIVIREKGGLSCLRFDDMVDGQRYHFGGPFYTVSKEEKAHWRREKRLLAEETTTAVQSAQPPTANTHSDVIYPDPSTNPNDPLLFQLSGVVVVPGETSAESTAFVLDSKLTPDTEKVDELLGKVELFKQHAKDMPQFRSVKVFVPVLGGYRWPTDVLKHCAIKRVSRVEPAAAGAGLRFFRQQFSTLAKRLIRR